ncbi:SPOR domain-containing protein [Candidatus Poribacteria bacterium]|nr:SPOR domain-containing protein [Candidatus Poribacteria bacterium]
MQFNFIQRSRQRLLRIIQKIGIVGMVLATVSVSAGTSSISQRDIFVGASARAVGMGSAFTAGPSATNGFLWNPSSLGFMDGVEVNMGGMPFPGNFSSRDQAFSVAANPQTFGVTNRNLGNVSFATWLDGWKNNTTESTQIVLLGYGLALGQRASAGANLRYYQNNTPIRTNFLWSVDLGMQFAYPLQKWGDSLTVGMNFSELSNGIRENGALLESAPLAARFGTTYELGGDTLFSADLAVRGANNVNWGERLRLHFGAEHWFIDGHVGLRFGYTALTASERFWSGELARGLSFRNSAGQLDYAYVSGSELEQGVHWISATLRWDGGDMVPISVATRTEPSDAEEAGPILMPETLEIDPETLDGTLDLSEPAISPNGDGVSDSTTFRLRLGEDDTVPLRWQLDIRDEYTESVWQKSGTGVPAEGVVWGGFSDTGNLVPDGNYEVQFHVLDAQDTRYLMDTGTVTVDLIPTTLELFAKTPTTVGVKAWDINPLDYWKLELFDAENVLIEQAEGNGSPPAEVVLNKIRANPNAVYTGKLDVRDIAGNQSMEQTQLQFRVSSQPKRASVSSKMTLMVGSFVELYYAEAMEERLRLQNPDQKVALRVATVDGRTMHRVTIGEFNTRAESAELKQHIQETLGIEPVLIALQ